jgi:hypothetical protein
MKPELNKLLNEERKRVFEPDQYFVQRVMARLKEQAREAADVWEIVPSATRQIFAFVLALFLIFLTLEMFIPITPSRSMVEAFLEPEQSAAESVWYTDIESPETPTSQQVLEQLIVLEEGEQ